MDKKFNNRQFWKYVLPSMFTMLLSGFYAIIDGLFVGNAVGDTALAAINIAYPIQVILNATAIGVGIGGAVILTTALGQNQKERADHALGSTFCLLLVLGAILSISLYTFAPALLKILGASGAVYTAAYEYIFVILIGGLLPVLGNGLNPLLRNRGKTLQATISMSSGLVTNIILDYVLVFRWNMGLHGAALATIIAQGVVACMSLILLWIGPMRHLEISHFIPSREIMIKIVRIGISPFGQTLVPCIITILTNWFCIQYGGDGALTIFSVVCYVLASAQLLLQGIGDGIQPLLSYHYGRDDQETIHYFYQKAFWMALATSLFLTVLTSVFSESLAQLFGVSHALMEGTKMALLLTSLSYPCIAIVRLTSAVFYATGKSKNSTILIYLEPCVLYPLCLVFFSSLFELTGIWVAYPAAQVILCVCSLVLQSPNIVVASTLSNKSA